MSATPAVAPATSQYRERLLGAYLLMGVLFGIVLTKGELVSWYRIEEALRFKGLYLYLVMASAFAVSAPGFALLGAGVGVMAVVCVAAVAGTWTYGYLRPRLPH